MSKSSRRNSVLERKPMSKARSTVRGPTSRRSERSRRTRPNWRSISAPAAAMSPTRSRAMPDGSSRRDLSCEMLAAVARTAREKGLGNIETVEAPAERLPFEDETFDFVASRFSAASLARLRRRASRSAPHVETRRPAVFVDVYAPGQALSRHAICRRSSCCATIPMCATTPSAQWLDALGRSGFAVEACTHLAASDGFPRLDCAHANAAR